MALYPLLYYINKNIPPSPHQLEKQSEAGDKELLAGNAMNTKKYSRPKFKKKKNVMAWVITYMI